VKAVVKRRRWRRRRVVVQDASIGRYYWDNKDDGSGDFDDAGLRR